MPEPAASLDHASSSPAAEEAIRWLVQWLKLGIETIGAVLIAIGVIIAVVKLVRHFIGHKPGGFVGIRLTLARYLALALEFQLGADILSTAIAPSWDQIGKLAAIAVIRTGLNHFLSLEMKAEEEEASRDEGAKSAAGTAHGAG